MPGKRALVVDDSKSARAFLQRLLQQHQLEVDEAETAEQAIDYLTRHRPDVIFMDHLMPGMDGFQAVQAIKNNPRTATIPILMYTSQEGELYVGQARALGAIGVLPKQVAPVDVSTVLEQLHLTPEAVRPQQAADSSGEGLADAGVADDLQHVAAAAEAVASTHASNATTLAASLATIPDPAALEITEDTLAGLRADFERSLDHRLELLLPQLRSMVRDAIPPPLPATVEPPRSGWVPWLLAALGFATALVLATLWQQQGARLAGLEAQLAEARATAAPARAAAIPDPMAAGAMQGDGTLLPPAGAGDAALRVLSVPFGETPLDGPRTEQLRQLVSQLAASGFTGTIDVAHRAGRFCLMGGPGTGYALAPVPLPYLQCDLVADAGDTEVGGGSPESLAFANALAELRKAHAGRISIEIHEATASALDRPYPQVGGTPPRVPTAGEWNDAAQANNRVEIRWRAAP